MGTDQHNESSPEATRERIIDAALSLFGKVGVKRATTRAIAAAAGVNEVTLFRHFGNKKNLLLASLERFRETGFAATFEQHLTGEYAADIARMAEAQVRDMARGYAILRLLLCESGEVPELGAMLRGGAETNRTALAQYFRRQMERGEVRSDLDPEVLAHAFDSLFSSYVFFETTFRGEPDGVLPPEEVVQSLVDIFVRGTSARAEGEDGR